MVWLSAWLGCERPASCLQLPSCLGRGSSRLGLGGQSGCSTREAAPPVRSGVRSLSGCRVQAEVCLSPSLHVGCSFHYLSIVRAWPHSETCYDPLSLQANGPACGLHRGNPCCAGGLVHTQERTSWCRECGPFVQSSGPNSWPYGKGLASSLPGPEGESFKATAAGGTTAG